MCCRLGRASPMIEHARNVPDALSLLGCAQEEIVILGTIEVAAEAEARNLTPYHDKMPEIIVGGEKFRRPVRFQHGRGKAFIDYFIFVGINKVDFLVFLQEFGDTKERIRLEQVVMIQQSDPFASSKLESGIQRP